MIALFQPETSRMVAAGLSCRPKRQKRTTQILMAGLVSFLLLFTLMMGFARESSADNAKTDESYATDFVLKDLNGKDVRLSDYKGRPVLLIFMTTWCRDCLASLPHLKEIYQQYHGKGLVMININVQETQARMAAYAQKYALPYPTLLDPEGTMSRKFGVGGVPVKALIDRDGRIICWNCRSMDSLLEKQFEAAVK